MLEQFFKKKTKFVVSKSFKVLYPLIKHKNPEASIVVIYNEWLKSKTK